MGMQAFIGVHIGQVQRPSAFAEVYYSGWSYTIMRLTRLPLDTPYSEVIDALIDRLRVLTQDGDYVVKIRVNATRVGSPVMKLVRERIPDLTEVYLSGGYKEEEKEGELILPKEVMISQLKILFQTNRISGLFNKPEPLMSAREKLQFDMFNLTKNEILNYETNVQVNPIHWNPETRTGENDDLAIVLGLACWPLQ